MINCYFCGGGGGSAVLLSVGPTIIINNRTTNWYLKLQRFRCSGSEWLRSFYAINGVFHIQNPFQNPIKDEMILKDPFECK